MIFTLAAGRKAAMVIVAAGMLLGGCAGAKKPQSPARSTSPATQARKIDPKQSAPSGADITLTDPCANRLHDLAGSLLLYYFVHHRLPGQIADLETMTGPAAPGALVCPVSGQLYVYNPRGLVSPDTKSQIILYDPAPSHAGRRWAISIVEPTDPNGALVTKVVLLPNAFFRPPTPVGTE